MKTAKYFVACALSTLVVGTAGAETIGYSSPNFDDNFQTILREAARAHAEALGHTIQIEDAREDVGTQLSQIQNFIASGVDAIVLAPVSTEATPQMTQIAADAGVPLVYINRRPADVAELGNNNTYVGSDNLHAGTLEAFEVCSQTGGTGSAVLLIGFLRNEDAVYRTDAVRQVNELDMCSGIEIVAEQEAEWQRTRANDVVSNWLASGIEFDIVYANNDEMALGAIQALRSAGIDMDTVTIAGIDATADALVAMQAGELDITVFQNAPAQAVGGVDAALSLIAGETLPAWVNIPFELVTPANMDDYIGAQ